MNETFSPDEEQTDPTELTERHSTEPDQTGPKFISEPPTKADTPSSKKLRAASPYLVEIPPLGPLPEVTHISEDEDLKQPTITPPALLQTPNDLVARLAARIGIVSIPPEDDYLPPVLDPKYQK